MKMDEIKKKQFKKEFKTKKNQSQEK